MVKITIQGLAYEISRIQSDDLQKITAFFDTSISVNEASVIISKMTEQVTINVSDYPEISQAISTLELAIFEKLQQKLEEPGSIQQPPNYTGFYNALPISSIFQFASQQAAENLATNAAYTDFSSALLALISGAGSSQALQSATSNLLSAMALPPDSPLLAEAQSLIDQFHLPITTSTPLEEPNA